MSVLDEPIGKSKPPVWRARLGWVIAGALLGQLAVCAVGAALDEHQPNIHVRVNGEDVSRNLGSKISIQNVYGRVEQSCNGACDDLVLEATSTDNLYSLRIVDAQGVCILCDKGDYVTAGLITDWTISGAERLTLNRKSKIE